MVVPVVTAVAEQEIPFVRQDLLLCTHLHLSSGGRCSGVRHGSAWVCPSPR